MVQDLAQGITRKVRERARSDADRKWHCFGEETVNSGDGRDFVEQVSYRAGILVQREFKAFYIACSAMTDLVITVFLEGFCCADDMHITVSFERIPF